MKSLAGKRAIVVGQGGECAGASIIALTAQGAEVASVDFDGVPNFDTYGRGTDIVVICPPLWTDVPATFDDGSAEQLGAALTQAGRWTSAAAIVMAPGGSIVHITGLSGLGGWRGWQAAGAYFAAIHNLVRSLAVELAASGVRVNALVPGISQTRGKTVATAIGESSKVVQGRIPLGEFMPEHALGNGLVYLVHPSSSYVTGEILAVDGGWDVWGRLNAVAT